MHAAVRTYSAPLVERGLLTCVRAEDHTKDCNRQGLTAAVSNSSYTVCANADESCLAP